MSIRQEFFFAALLASLGLAVPRGAEAGPPAGKCELRPGQRLEIELEDTTPLLCQTTLETGSWRLVVEQIHIDIELRAHTDDGRKTLGPADNPIGRFGPETLLFTADSPGPWHFRLEPKEDTEAGGRLRLELSPQSSISKARARADRAMMAGGLAHAEGTPEARKRALAHYREAKKTAKGYDPRLEAWALDAEAMLLRRAGEDLEARASFAELAEKWIELGEPSRQAAALNNAALIDARRGEYEQARQSFQRAQALHRQSGDVESAAIARNNLCLMLHRQGELEPARICYQAVLETLRGLQRRDSLATVLNNLGGVHYLMGDAAAARRHYEEALRLRRAQGDPTREADPLNNLAALQRHVGRWQDALTLYHQALELQQASGDRWGEAKTHNNIGHAYLTLGQLDRSLPSFERSLELRRQLEDRRGQAVTLNNLGSLHHQLRHHALAVTFRRQALEIRRQLGDRRGEARTLVGVAREESALGEAEKALESLNTAVARLQDIGDRPSLAWALAERGSLRLAHPIADPDREATLGDLERSLELYAEMGNLIGSIAPLVSLAEMHQRRGDLRLALKSAEEAARRLESLREDVGSPDLRSAFTTSRLRAWELPVEILMQLERSESGSGHAAKALEAAERARARSLLDLLAESAIDLLAGADVELLEKKNILEQDLRLLARNRRSLSRKSPREARPKEARLEAAVQRALTELGEIEASIRRAHPDYEEWVKPAPLDVAAMQRLLDEDTTLLYFTLGEKRSFLWRVTQGQVKATDLPARQVIEGLAHRVHRELGTFESGLSPAPRPEPLIRLSSILFGAAAQRLSLDRITPGPDDSKRLVIVPDGALHLIPFGALPHPISLDPLIESHEIVSLPSVSALDSLRHRRRQPPSRQIAVFADPVFSLEDPRIEIPEPSPNPSRTSRESKSAPLSRLPASRLEAEAIAAFADDIWPAVGLESRRQAVIEGPLEEFRFVHFATHGLVDTERPDLSGLMLSTLDNQGRDIDGFLGLRDIYGLKLNADLVVLSGCRTALGQELRGEGLVGLSRAFFYAGASRVVASLWQVEDRATAELMRHFYEGLLERGEKPASALRSAQLEISRQRRWQSPYYWAGFVLIGDWR